MQEREVFRRRTLPHWDVPGAIYFVTCCLEGSIPAQGRLDIKRYRQDLGKRPLPEGMTSEEWKLKKWKLTFARSEKWMDLQPGVKHLEDSRLAAEVVNTMYFFASERYDLIAYVVMPSHFHWVFRPRDEWVESLVDKGAQRPPRERIMHSLKLHTALEGNKMLNTSGTFWQDESYDHCIMDEDELERIVEYVEYNPVKAGLARAPEEWQYSSACDRARYKIVLGRPLTR